MTEYVLSGGTKKAAIKHYELLENTMVVKTSYDTLYRR